jgi:hypothetical protein
MSGDGLMASLALGTVRSVMPPSESACNSAECLINYMQIPLTALIDQLASLGEWYGSYSTTAQSPLTPTPIHFRHSGAGVPNHGVPYSAI